MGRHAEFHLILLVVLVMMVSTAGAKKRETSYIIFGKGQRITGTIIAEFKTKSSKECSVR